MKPINSKERSKLFWQFIFIFFALCILPVSIIAYSYLVVPEKLSEVEQVKLQNYTAFERTQKLLIKQLSNIDTNINTLASNVNDPQMLNAQVSKALANLQDIDTTVLIKVIQKGYSNHLEHVMSYIHSNETNNKLRNDLTKAQADLDKCNSDLRNKIMMGQPQPMSQPH